MCDTITGERVLISPLLDVRTVAQILGVTERWVYDAVRQGRIPYLRIGSRIRFIPASLQEWIDSQGKTY